MITLARIQGPSMGFANFQKPVLQTPHRMGLDISIPPMPKLPPMDFPLDAGSLAPADGGGADGGGAPAPAPLPGETPAPGGAVTLPGEIAPPGYYQQPPTYLFPVQEVPGPTAPAPAPAASDSAGLPTWALVGGALLAGVVLAKLL